MGLAAGVVRQKFAETVWMITATDSLTTDVQPAAAAVAAAIAHHTIRFGIIPTMVAKLGNTATKNMLDVGNPDGDGSQKPPNVIGRKGEIAILALKLVRLYRSYLVT